RRRWLYGRHGLGAKSYGVVLHAPFAGHPPRILHGADQAAVAWARAASEVCHPAPMVQSSRRLAPATRGRSGAEERHRGDADVFRSRVLSASRYIGNTVLTSAVRLFMDRRKEAPHEGAFVFSDVRHPRFNASIRR